MQSAQAQTTSESIVYQPTEFQPQQAFYENEPQVSLQTEPSFYQPQEFRPPPGLTVTQQATRATPQLVLYNQADDADPLANMVYGVQKSGYHVQFTTNESLIIPTFDPTEDPLINFPKVTRPNNSYMTMEGSGFLS